MVWEIGIKEKELRLYYYALDIMTATPSKDWQSSLLKKSGVVMPTISMFYGIIISMFFEIKEKHHLPHIHVRYQGMKASIAIEDGSLLAGEIPPRQLRMIQVWVDIHREELLADWELAKEGQEPFRIDPLK
jgi:hypothetical protein